MGNGDGRGVVMGMEGCGNGVGRGVVVLKVGLVCWRCGSVGGFYKIWVMGFKGFRRDVLELEGFRSDG